METFEDLYARAVVRHGGEEAVEASLPKPKSTRQLSSLGDDRYLAEMARCIFRAGFVWRVVEAKWPGFEEAFGGFDPERLAHSTDADIDALSSDARIIRNATKIESVRSNASFVLDVAQEHGSFGKFVSRWPEEDIVSLWQHLKKSGSRLGGDTGPMFLRGVGKDTFMLSRDVVGSLVEQGVVTKKPTSKKDLAAVQDAFNRWREESGRPLCQLSRIVALGHGEVHER